MANQKVEKIKELYKVGSNKKVLCRCKLCGNEFEMWENHYKQGQTSCRCLQFKKSNPRLYRIWTNMKTRCSNPTSPSYENYGAKGVTVCDEWQNFKAFYDWSIANGYKEDLTIDRCNPKGNYEPSNCRWVDIITQANNKTTNIIFFGTSLKRICEKYGFNYKTEHTYLSRHGYDAELNRLNEKINLDRLIQKGESND